MSSIDERIVSIKFNNAQFEAGVRTTISSLDGLKKSLNFSSGVSALGDLDAAGKKVNLKLNNAGFDASVKGVIDSSNALKNNLKFDGVAQGLSDLDSAGKRVSFKLDATSFQNGARGIVDAATTIKNSLTFENVERGIGSLKTSVQNFNMNTVVTGVQTAVKSLGDLDLAAKRLDLSSIGTSVEEIGNKFNLMSVAGIAALATLASKAASTGLQMASSLFIDPAKSGLAEYELNLGSIQTIMANTQSEGSTLGDVNGALDELNAYSDKTIYNFAEMAKNIGTFTSAGVKLDDSTNAIKGIANLAALSGSNSEQASSAMYQLSQAMSAGKVGLQDWNSVVNAGMGGKVFQDALIETARNQGSNVDALIAKNGSFRESLQDGWITTEVMTETLSKMTGDLTDEQLASMGYTADQIVGIQAMAKTAGDAATKIKTFSQLTGTLSEITGSGWAQTWKLILGDFEQAKEMWTNVYGVLGQMVQGSADARNKLLGDWNALGGRTVMIEAVSNAFKALMGVVKPITDAFREVFPPSTGQQLYDFTVVIRNLTAAMIPGEATTSLLKNTFKLLFTIIKIGVDIIKGALSVVFAFFKAFATGGDSVAGSMKPLTDFMAKLTESLANSKFVENFFLGLATVAATLGGALARVVPIVVMIAAAIYQFGYDVSGVAMHYVSKFARFLGGELVSGLSTAIDFFYKIVEVVLLFVSSLGEGVDVAMTRVRERMESFGRLGDSIANMWNQAKEAGARAWEAMRPLRDAISQMFDDIKREISNALTDVNFDDTLDMVNTGLLVGLVLLFKNFFKKMMGLGNGARDGLTNGLTGMVDSVKGVFEGLTGTLGAMQQNLKADTLVKLAIAIGIMAASVVVLSMIDSAKLTQALIGIGVMVKILMGAMLSLDAMSTGTGFLKIPFIAASMILLATALTILSIPVLILSRLSWMELIKGLAGVAVLMKVLSGAVESMAQNPADLIATGLGLIAVAIAVNILADAVAKMGALSFGELIKGLGGVSVVLFALSKTVESMARNPADLIATGLGLVAIAFAVKILASAVSDFGSMDIPTIIQGIAALAIVMVVLQNFTKTVGNVTGLIQTSIGIVIIGAAMKIMASALTDLGTIDIGVLAKGLGAMAIALGIIGFAANMMPADMLVKAAALIVISIALGMLAGVIETIGGLSMEVLAKGIITLAIALGIIAIATTAMTAALPGAAAMFVVAAALTLLAPVLVTLGAMSWSEIGMGMAALAATFIVVGLAALVLTPVIPMILALGVSIAMLGVGLMSIGAGVALFGLGLVAIGGAVTVAGPALILFVGAILKLIPLAMEELGKGIVAFAGVIGNALPIFLEAFVGLLMTLLSAIDRVFPKLMDTLWKVIVGLVDLILRAVPLFVDSGMKLITGILTGVGNNIGQLVDAAARVIVEFLNGLSRNLPSIVQAGANLIVTFVESLAAGVRNNSARMNAAGLELAQAIVQGMTNGIANGAGAIVNAAKDMAGRALNAAKDLLGINSPSKEFFKIGQWVDEGFALGIDKYSDKVSQAVRGVGGSALDTLKSTMSNIDSQVGDGMDLAPTIRPVLDLSAVKRDSGLISGMLAPNTLDLNSSYAKASTLSSAERVMRERTLTPTDAQPAQSVTSIHLEQHNTSPEPLSEIDIYRNTKNQLSTLKGLVTA